MWHEQLPLSAHYTYIFKVFFIDKSLDVPCLINPKKSGFFAAQIEKLNKIKK